MEIPAQGIFDVGKLTAMKNHSIFEGVATVDEVGVTVRGAVVVGFFMIGSA